MYPLTSHSVRANKPIYLSTSPAKSPRAPFPLHLSEKVPRNTFDQHPGTRCSRNGPQQSTNHSQYASWSIHPQPRKVRNSVIRCAIAQSSSQHSESGPPAVFSVFPPVRGPIPSSGNSSSACFPAIPHSPEEQTGLSSPLPSVQTCVPNFSWKSEGIRGRVYFLLLPTAITPARELQNQ